MGNIIYKPEQIIPKLREIEVLVSQGQMVQEAVRSVGISTTTYRRWREKFGGMEIDQAKQLKVLEVENVRLKKAVADLTLDNQMLKEVSRGKF